MVILEIYLPQVRPPVLAIISSNTPRNAAADSTAAASTAAAGPIRPVEVTSAFSVTRPRTAGGVGEQGIMDPLSARLAAASQC